MFYFNILTENCETNNKVNYLNAATNNIVTTFSLKRIKTVLK